MRGFQRNFVKAYYMEREGLEDYILTWEKFVEFFPPLPQPLAKKDFVERFKVLYAHPLTLEEVKDRFPPEDLRVKNFDKICDYFYDVVVLHRYEYLEQFFNNYLRWRTPDELDWTEHALLHTTTGKDGEDKLISLQKNDCSRRLVRNLFYRELLDTTRITNTANNKWSFWAILINLYNNLTLDGRWFAPSSISLMLKPKNKKAQSTNYNAMFYLLQAYQPKASILNPYTVKWILTHLLTPEPNPIQSSSRARTRKTRGLRLFSPELSWGSFALGFLESDGWTDYVGIDVLPRACAIVRAMGREGTGREGKKITTICQPSEDVAKEITTRSTKSASAFAKYKNYFDACIVCPPYYDMEIYTDPTGEQSTTKYKTYEEWLTGYWTPTARLCSVILRKNGLLGIILNNYKSLAGVDHNLKTEMIALLPHNLRLMDKYYLVNRTSPLRENAKDRTETLFIFQKNPEKTPSPL